MSASDESIVTIALTNNVVVDLAQLARASASRGSFEPSYRVAGRTEWP
jgi:hypothetical protein